MKTVILDFSQMAHATFFANQSSPEFKILPVEEQLDLWRHLMLNSIRAMIVTHKPNEVILAIDYGSWRKEAFKFYKMRRASKKEASSFDFTYFYEFVNTFLKELDENFPFKIIKSYGAEADDVVAILVDHLRTGREEIIIVSGDKDFKQLLKYKNVKLYIPQKQEFCECENPARFLLEQILSGDTVDDIPNVRSDDDTFMCDTKRQKPFGPVAIEKALAEGLENFFNTCGYENIKENFKRNQRLIALTPEFIPEKIWSDVVRVYTEITDEQRKKASLGQYILSQSKINKYLVSKNLNVLIDQSSDFVYKLAV